MIPMKLQILCKEERLENLSDDTFVINCNICKGMNSFNSIKTILEEYCDEIEEIIYPECDIIKKILNKK